MINQITVFLENKEGRLAALVRSLADAGINMQALTIADTTDYGVARIICDDPTGAVMALNEQGYRATLTKVSAIAVPNVPGGLAKLLNVLDDNDVNVEYGYCFSTAADYAVDVLKVRGPETAIPAIEAAGFKILQPADIGQKE